MVREVDEGEKRKEEYREIDRIYKIDSNIHMNL